MNVVPLRKVDLAQELRDLADALESGEHPEMADGVIVLAGGSEIKVFAAGGACEDATLVHYLLCCGQRVLEQPLTLSAILGK